MSAQGTGAAIVSRGLTKTYGSKNVIDGLDMEVREGDIYGFVGRNGTGKSTTMKLVCGLISPTSGQLTVLGGKPDDRSGFIGADALIEAPGLLERMSAKENLLYKARALGVEKPAAHCDHLLELVGLAKTGSKEARSFSLGMKQRLGIALAMVGKPRLLLLDEPFNGLDPAATHEMRESLQRLNREEGLTIVVSSHILDQLNRFATRFGVIDAGKMVMEFESSRMAEMSTKAVRVRCDDMERAAQVLASVPGADIARAKDGAILVRGAEVADEDVSLALFNAGLRVIELVRTGQDVEEFFLGLMGAGAPGATPSSATATTEGGR